MFTSRALGDVYQTVQIQRDGMITRLNNITALKTVKLRRVETLMKPSVLRDALTTRAAYQYNMQQ